MSENIFQRWDKTGLLNDLPEEDKPKFAQLFQNQADYSLKAFKGFPRTYETAFFNVQLPLVRRLFEALSFEWDVVDSPCFVFEGEEQCVCTEKFLSHHNLEEPEGTSVYAAMDFEVEITSIFSERFSQELNEKYRGKRVFFFTPLVVLGRVQEEYRPALKVGFQAKEVG